MVVLTQTTNKVPEYLIKKILQRMSKKLLSSSFQKFLSPDLPFNERANTKGNHYKLQNHYFHYDL